jgi:hypothetical protein
MIGMQEYTSLRIEAPLAAALKERAERSGLSVNAMASELIRREVDHDVRAPGRPDALPVGLGPLSDAWKAQVERPAGQHHWAVVYEEPDGLFIGAVGDVRLSPLFAEVVLHVSGLRVTVPRAKIVGWEKLNGSEYDILSFAVGIQGWGAFLHEAVDVSGREVNRVYWPPRRGPIRGPARGPTAQLSAEQPKPRHALKRPKR